jgi:phosphate transport system substrate-binding protein
MKTSKMVVRGILAAALVAIMPIAFAVTPKLINGAGATFPYPIYSKWFSEYAKIDPSVNFNYQSIGSGGGIKQITAETVDFGASDAALTDQQLWAAPGRLLHIPMVGGAVAVTYNLEGINKPLNLSPDVLADIFLGKIDKWNDPRIAQDNAGVSLPGTGIVVAHRSDGSGTSNIFTDYLSSVSAEWKKKVGKGTSVNWPVGLGGKGNEGVAGLLKQTPGAIGYVELAYAVKNNLAYAAMKNKSGKFIPPSLESTTAAIAGKASNMPADFRVSLVNPDSADAYPIAGFTWILIYKHQKDAFIGKKIVEFLSWAVHDGQNYTKELLYAPLPAPVVQKIDEKLKEVTY